MGIPCPKPVPAVATKHAKRTQAKAALEQAYADVDARDAGYCWVTGRYTQPGAIDARVRREHHHLIARSLAPERIDDPTNIVTVCAEAHSLFKAGWLVSEGIDARREVRFHWTEHVRHKDKPFVIKARRAGHEE